MDQAGTKARILVVEDESIVALDMRSRLLSMGYDVVGIAASGEEVLDLVRKTKPELILMDIKLQGDLDGVDTAELVHKADDIPIIFVTAFADERTLARAKVTQAFGYILKPFQEREVLISIEMALYKHVLEKDLRVNREWLRGTMNAISDSVVALDPDDRVVFMNRSAELLLKTDVQAAQGKRIDEFCSFAENVGLSNYLSPSKDAPSIPDDSERELRLLMMTIGTAKIPVELIRTKIRSDASENAGHVLSIRDISETIKAEAVKTRLAAIVSNSFDAILSIDTSLKIVSWNLGAELIYGYSADEIIGSSVQKLLVDERDRVQFHNFVDFVLEGKEVGRIETVRRCRSGKTIVVSMSLSPLKDAEGKVVEIACIERDVSAEKEYETSLVQAKQNAEEGSRIKSEFLSNMSHELRTPLNSIMGMIELSRDMSAADEQREYLEIARQSADNLLFLINSILDFSKIEAGKMRINSIAFDPVEAVEDCIEEVSVQAYRKGLSLVFRAEPGLPSSIEGDPRRFKQILTNLLSNGIKFTESGGVRVDLSARPAPDPSAVLLELIVRDTGIGITADRLTAIWESFTQLDGSSTRAYGGTGLGLSIVKSLVELMGGSVAVESEPGKGSAFTVSLPFVLSDDSVLRTDESAVSSEVSALLAIPFDDERAILAELLESWGCSVAILQNMDAVIRELSAVDKDRPRLIVLDDKMPDRKRLFSCFESKECGSLLMNRLVILSTIGVRDDPGWKALSGSAQFLFKPIRRAALRKCLDSVVSSAGKPATTEEKPAREDLSIQAAETIVKEQSVSREQRIRSEIVSDALILSSLERFLQEADAVGSVPGALLEGSAARCRRELESMHATILPQFLFKVVLACRREDPEAVSIELSRIREAIITATRNGEND